MNTSRAAYPAAPAIPMQQQKQAAQAQAPTQAPIVEDTGLIRRLVLPSGWVEQAHDFFRAKEERLLRIFGIQDRRVALRLSTIGSLVDQQSHNSLVMLLGKPPHLLHHDELPALSEVTRPLVATVNEQGKMLVLLSAKTFDVNGKRVLFVDGTYKGTDCHFLAMYWNASMWPSDPRVQHITFEARGADYLANLSKVKVALKTIQWKVF